MLGGVRLAYRRSGLLLVSAWMILAIPSAYAGTWVTDAKSGCQVWDPDPQVDEAVIWSGTCNNGRAEGPGTVQWIKSGKAIETDKGEWRDGRQAGNGVQAWDSGRYEGELANGVPNGRGVLTMKKLHYEGQFRDGKPNGTGSLTEAGDTVRGTWKDGCLQGRRKASIGVPLSVCR
jgi:hypothetical protein